MEQNDAVLDSHKQALVHNLEKFTVKSEVKIRVPQVHYLKHSHENHELNLYARLIKQGERENGEKSSANEKEKGVAQHFRVLWLQVIVEFTILSLNFFVSK